MNMESSEQFEYLQRAASGSFTLDLQRAESLLESTRRLLVARGEAFKGCWGRQLAAMEALGGVADMEALTEWNRAHVPDCLEAWHSHLAGGTQALQALQAECGSALREQALEWGRTSVEALEMGAAETPALQPWADWCRALLNSGVEAAEQFDGLMASMQVPQAPAAVKPVAAPTRRAAPRRKAA